MLVVGVVGLGWGGRRGVSMSVRCIIGKQLVVVVVCVYVCECVVVGRGLVMVVNGG